MTTDEETDRIMRGARAGLMAQKKLAWGNAWETHFSWPDTPEEKRAYPHNPRADVDLALEFARAALQETIANLKTVLKREAATIARYDAKLDAAEKALLTAGEFIMALRKTISEGGEVSDDAMLNAAFACRDAALANKE